MLRFINSAFMKKLWKDRNQKITLVKIEMIESGVNMKTKETIA